MHVPVDMAGLALGSAQLLALSGSRQGLKNHLWMIFMNVKHNCGKVCTVHGALNALLDVDGVSLCPP